MKFHIQEIVVVLTTLLYSLFVSVDGRMYIVGQVIPVRSNNFAPIYNNNVQHEQKSVPLQYKFGVSNEVMEGMRLEKYRVPSLTHWPDGSLAPKEQVPYLLVAVPNHEERNRY